MVNSAVTSFAAFTLKTTGRAASIISEIGISLPFDAAGVNKSDQRIYQTRALWDTGATHCVVTQQTAQALGLKPISIAQVTHAGGVSQANVYLVNFYLPNNLVIPGVRVTECTDTAGHFGAIVGMNVITLGDLSITNPGGMTTVSFRVPSVKEIDYVAEANQMNRERARSLNVGRNDPCPCGSGKKFKHCHGKQA